VVLFALSSFLASAQNSAPVAQPIFDTIPAARNIACPGVITESVDASDVAHGIFRVHETIPVNSSEALTLLYPKWLPGFHSDGGPIMNLAGLTIMSGNQALRWSRDPVDMYAFHVDIPSGTSSIRVQFQFLAPTEENQGRIVSTPQMLDLEWNNVILYPAGYYVRQITVDPSLKLPDGWKAACALKVVSKRGSAVHYEKTPLDTLVDSPVLSGANVRVETLSPDVRLNIVADEPEELAASDEQLQSHRNLVTQAIKLFGAQHYDHYDFLLALSDRQSPIGLEHHRSSENSTVGGYFTDWDDTLARRYLVPHEYVHSWNGKFRRPADLWTPDYRTPMRDSLLWVYEGQTQFWGVVLATRAGIVSRDDTLGALAALAARLDTDAGRTWRPLEDTTDDPIIASRRPQGWRSWQRSEDYYNEGLLIWLDADTLIREKSNGDKSLDDFARAFFGVNDRDWGELTYTFDDIVNTLNQIQPYDWAAFLHARLDNVSQHAPLDGITRGGYQLVYTNTPTAFFKSNEKMRKTTDLTYSGGFVLNKEGTVTDVAWDGPAFNAGLTVGSKLIAVDDREFDADRLKTAIKAEKSPLHLLIKTGDIYRTVEFNYDGGLRYPALERVAQGPSTLEALLAHKP
jgi:predicted metalloprotease with PDZ domain